MIFDQLSRAAGTAAQHFSTCTVRHTDHRSVIAHDSLHGVVPKSLPGAGRTAKGAWLREGMSSSEGVATASAKATAPISFSASASQHGRPCDYMYQQRPDRYSKITSVSGDSRKLQTPRR